MPRTQQLALQISRQDIFRNSLGHSKEPGPLRIRVRACLGQVAELAAQ